MMIAGQAGLPISFEAFPLRPLDLPSQHGKIEAKGGENMQSCNKTDKELAVEAVIEYTKSWNACTTMSPMRAEQFLDMLKATYNTIKNLE